MNTPPALSHTLDPSGYVRARRERVRGRASPPDAPQAGAEAPRVRMSPGEGHASPDILLPALGKARLRVEEVVYVGDAVWDVMASTALRISCIGLGCGGTSTSELGAVGAVETWSDPADLLENFERSILGSFG